MKYISMQEYLLMAGCLLSTENLDSEIYYNDIDPDIVLNDDYEVGVVDMDEDEVVDFAFLKDTGNYNTYWSEEYRYFTALWCGPEVYLNEVAGSYFTVGSNASSSFLTYRPYVLPAAFPVNQMLSFQTNGFQMMAYKIFTSDGNFWDFGGNWWPEQIDQFIGVKFKAADSEYHYGWIRVSVMDSSSTLIIHDAAFEELPNTVIFTGETTGSANGINSFSGEWLNINLLGNTLEFNCNPAVNYKNFRCKIYDMSGRIVYSEIFIWNSQQLNLENFHGEFIVCCEAENHMMVDKIILM